MSRCVEGRPADKSAGPPRGVCLAPKLRWAYALLPGAGHCISLVACYIRSPERPRLGLDGLIPRIS